MIFTFDKKEEQENNKRDTWIVDTIGRKHYFDIKDIKFNSPEFESGTYKIMAYIVKETTIIYVTYGIGSSREEAYENLKSEIQNKTWEK